MSTPVQLCWMPTWSCQQYAKDGGGHNPKCPYCPLGVRNGRLTWFGKEGAANGSVVAAEMINFLVRHQSLLGSRLTISGGEPLISTMLTPVLSEIVRRGFAWGITSNTLLHPPLARLSAALSGFHSCTSWTASYHPLSTDHDAFEDNIRFLRLNGSRWLYANVVANQETAGKVIASLDWLLMLPIDRINILIDMYRGVGDIATGTQAEEAIRELARQHPLRVAIVGTGKTITGVNCQTRGRFLVVSPIGVIYQCVRKCYEDIEPIGHIRDAVLAPNEETSWCGLDCPHTCDQIKHQK